MPKTSVVIFTMYEGLLGNPLTKILGIAAVVPKSDGVGKLLGRIEALLDAPRRARYARTLILSCGADTRRPEYQNLHSYFQEIKEQYTNAETTKQRLDLLKIAREILKQAQEQVAEFQDEIDRMRKS